jgi:type III pantothenate kinase
MLLAIGVGNSTSRFGVYNGTEWIGHWRLRTVHNRMPDEYSVLFDGLLGQVGVEMTNVDTVVMASVVPPVTGMVAQMLRSRTGREPLILGPGVRTGIRIRTENPVEMGADLVANAVAAYEMTQGACLAVDFGTALSFTAVAEKGDLVGVAIAPGLSSAVRALSRNTAQLPSVQLASPGTAIGKNTVHAIQSGVVFGYVGMVESLVDRMKDELGGTVRVIGTGGQSEIIAPLTDRFDQVDPWLTLEGLRLVSEKNKP